MKDGLPLITNDTSSPYFLSQKVIERVSSTYSNVLRVGERAPGGVAGTYTCTVSNDLGSDSRTVVVIDGKIIYLHSISFL